VAYLENIFSFDKEEMLPQLYFTELELRQESLIYTPPDADFHKDWFKPGLLKLLKNQQQGDQWLPVRRVYFHLPIKISR